MPPGTFPPRTTPGWSAPSTTTRPTVWTTAWMRRRGSSSTGRTGRATPTPTPGRTPAWAQLRTTSAPGQDYVEGWRYQDPGPDNPTAPAPAMTPAAAFAQACSTTTTTTTSGGRRWVIGWWKRIGRPDAEHRSDDALRRPNRRPRPRRDRGAARREHAHAVTTTTQSQRLGQDGSTDDLRRAPARRPVAPRSELDLTRRSRTSPTKLAEADTVRTRSEWW